MPYVSDAQRKWAHTDSAKKAGFPTAEWDKESKGQSNLPEHSAKNKPSAEVKKAIKHSTSEDKHEYVARTGLAPLGKKYEDWLERKTGGDFSDSNMAKVFGGDGSPEPLKKGERSIPEKAYMKEFGEDPRDDDYPKKGLGEFGHLSPKSVKEGIRPMKPVPAKGKSVKIGASDAEKAAAKKRVLANQAAEEKRRARKEPDIESF